VPGLTRLADTLNSPVFRALPTDLGEFLEVINELSRRLSPLSQFADQASGLFGLRIPGLSRPVATATAPARPAPPPEPAATASPATKQAAAKRKAPARKKAPSKKAPAKKKAAARRR
jgi:hypothetical protein